MSHAGTEVLEEEVREQVIDLAQLTNIDSYRQFVAQVAAGQGPSQVILNRTPDHAAVVLASIFSQAADHIQILSHELLPTVYGQENVITAAVNFLNTRPNGRIQVLVEVPVNVEAHPFLRAINAADRNRVTFQQIPAALQNTYRFNFAVADGSSYRFEKDRDTSEATIRFRDEDFGHDLEGAFAHLIQLANVVR